MVVIGSKWALNWGCMGKNSRQYNYYFYLSVTIWQCVLIQIHNISTESALMYTNFKNYLESEKLKIV